MNRSSADSSRDNRKEHDDYDRTRDAADARKEAAANGIDLPIEQTAVWADFQSRRGRGTVGQPAHP